MSGLPKSMKWIATMATGFIVAAAACATGTDLAPGSPDPSLCDIICDCVECNDDQAACLKEWTALENRAVGVRCDDLYDAYVACYKRDAVCNNEQMRVPPSCLSASGALNQCLTESTPVCTTTNNGVCDEPEGTGTCAEGTDVVDCGGGPVCATTNNGVCDEPEGTGTCAEGTDVVDCAAAGNCPYVNDTVCDEPEGTGACPEGSDFADCNCPYQNDGECDEPEGTGACPEGSDPFDC
ncbi:hypothetical protein [Chondromyces crocatus]|nr:hypothetical protein [Chondromyces crocatus]